MAVRSSVILHRLARSMPICCAEVRVSSWIVSTGLSPVKMWLRVNAASVLCCSSSRSRLRFQIFAAGLPPGILAITASLWDNCFIVLRKAFLRARPHLTGAPTEGRSDPCHGLPRPSAVEIAPVKRAEQLIDADVRSGAERLSQDGRDGVRFLFGERLYQGGGGYVLVRPTQPLFRGHDRRHVRASGCP